MNDREYLVRHYAELGAHLAVVEEPPAPPPVESPTGRRPTLLWTEQRQRVYNLMREEGEAGADTLGGIWYRLIISNAKGNRYGDTGIWGAHGYQITGNPEFVEHAWRKFGPALATPLKDANGNREVAAERVVIADRLWPGLSELRRVEVLTAFDRMCGHAGALATLTSDSDQITGCYFALLFYKHAFADMHPPAATFFDEPHIGGLDVTGDDRATWRNTIAGYIRKAAGGEWIESSEYNLGTVRLLAIGVEGARSVLGQDHFPECTAWLRDRQTAARHRYMKTPDLLHAHQYGDEERPREPVAYSFATTAALFDAPEARKFVYDLVAKHGATGTYSAEPWGKAFLLFDPYGPTDHPELPRVFNAPGPGVFTARSHWKPDASMLCGHFLNAESGPYVHHEGTQYGDWQLYRRGTWAMTRPVCYAGVALDGRGINQVLHRGLGSAREFRGAYEFKEGNGWVGVAGTTGGAATAVKHRQPPPVFLHEWSRWLVWLYTETCDTVLIVDRSHCDDPLTLARLASYGDAEESRIRASMGVENPDRRGLRRWQFHTQVAPTFGTRRAFWENGAEQAELRWFGELESSVVDLAVAWAAPAFNMKATEKQFQQIALVSDRAGFEVNVFALNFGQAAHFPTISSGQTGDVITVRVGSRAFEFNAKPGPKLVNPDETGAYNPLNTPVLQKVRGAFRELL